MSRIPARIPGLGRDLFAAHAIDRHTDVDQVAAGIRDKGLVTVRGLDSRHAVLAFASRLLDIVAHRDSDSDGLTSILDTTRHTGRTGFAGLGKDALPSHTERSGLHIPPRLMLIACARPADQGGECILTDGRAVHADLAAHHPDAADALAEDRAGFFGGQDGVFAPVFRSHPAGTVSMRLRLDDLVRWNPLVQPHIPALTKAINHHQQQLRLDADDAYLIDNSRWLHGRTSFRGPRLVYRALGNPQFHLAPGFTPTKDHARTPTAPGHAP